MVVTALRRPASCLYLTWTSRLPSAWTSCCTLPSRTSCATWPMLRTVGAPSLVTNVAHMARTATMSTIQTRLPRSQRCSGINDSPARDRGGHRCAAVPRGASISLLNETSLSCIYSRIQHRNIRQIAIFARVVEAVANHELVRDRETDQIDLDLDRFWFLFLQQCDDPQVARVPPQQYIEQVLQSESTVDDVFDNNNAPTFDIFVEILQDAHYTRALRRRPIRGDRHEIDFERDRHLPHQVRHECNGAVEDSHQQRHVIAVGLVELFRHLGGSRPNLTVTYQDPGHTGRAWLVVAHGLSSSRLAVRSARSIPRSRRTVQPSPISSAGPPRRDWASRSTASVRSAEIQLAFVVSSSQSRITRR